MTFFSPFPTPTYRSAWPRARFALAGLALGVVGQLVGVAGDADRIRVTSLEIQGRIVSHADISRSDQLFNLTAGFQLVTMMVAAVLFLVWLHRIIANGPALGGAELRFTPRWAVGWWFVPFANLVRPVQVLSEAWSTSSVEMAVSTRGARASVKLPIFLRVWWGLWVLWWCLSVIEPVAGNDPTTTTLHGRAMIDVVVSLTYACAGLVCLVVVSRLTRSQDQRNEARTSLPTTVQGLPVSAEITPE